MGPWRRGISLCWPGNPLHEVYLSKSRNDAGYRTAYIYGSLSLAEPRAHGHVVVPPRQSTSGAGWRTVFFDKNG